MTSRDLYTATIISEWFINYTTISVLAATISNTTWKCHLLSPLEWLHHCYVWCWGLYKLYRQFALTPTKECCSNLQMVNRKIKENITFLTLTYIWYTFHGSKGTHMIRTAVSHYYGDKSWIDLLTPLYYLRVSVFSAPLSLIFAISVFSTSYITLFFFVSRHHLYKEKEKSKCSYIPFIKFTAQLRYDLSNLMANYTPEWKQMRNKKYRILFILGEVKNRN